MADVTDVSICSNALLMLGANTISSFDDGSDRARAAGNLFPIVRDAVLRGHPWNCAIKRVKLSPNVVFPAFDWAYAYTLPDDYVRTLSCGERGAEHEFKVESRLLLCDENPLLLRYIWRNTDPTTWDDLLVWCVTKAMKAALAYPVTQSTSLEKLVSDTLRDELKIARAVDAQDETPEAFGNSPLLEARLGGRWW